MHAGAAAAILYNNAANGPGNFNGTLGTVDDNGTPWIPAISLSQTDGEAVAAASGDRERVQCRDGMELRQRCVDGHAARDRSRRVDPREEPEAHA